MSQVTINLAQAFTTAELKEMRNKMLAAEEAKKLEGKK